MVDNARKTSFLPYGSGGENWILLCIFFSFHHRVRYNRWSFFFLLRETFSEEIFVVSKVKLNNKFLGLGNWRNLRADLCGIVSLSNLRILDFKRDEKKFTSKRDEKVAHWLSYKFTFFFLRVSSFRGGFDGIAVLGMEGVTEWRYGFLERFFAEVPTENDAKWI